jgi:hypothetical protein
MKNQRAVSVRVLACFLVSAAALGMLSSVAGAEVTAFTVTLTPRRAEPGATVAIASSCTFTEGDEFSKVEVSLESTTVTLTPLGPPVADGAGFRQDLSGSIIAPSEPGIYLVTERCLTVNGESSGNQALTVLTPSTTVPETTVPTSTPPTSSVPSSTASQPVPSAAGATAAAAGPANPQELAVTGRYSAYSAMFGAALLLLGLGFSLLSRRVEAS